MIRTSLGLATQVASAQCADPRGNSFCTNNGQATNVDVPNPNASNSDVVNPDAPISMAGGAQISADPAGGAPGDVITIAGQGFHPNDNLYLNVIDASAQRLDTRSAPIRCVQTDNYTVVDAQNKGLGCTAAAVGGLSRAAPDGTFSGAIQIPASAAAGPATVCIDSTVSRTCVNIMIADGN